LEKLVWPDPELDEIKRILCKEHDFSEDRIQSTLNRLSKTLEELHGSTKQSALSDFF
jgi:hypothetical protein